MPIAVGVVILVEIIMALADPRDGNGRPMV